jgi:hypothetical protein
MTERVGRHWWAMSALVAERCGDHPRLQACFRRRRVRTAMVAAGVWLELAGGLGRIEARGRAVLCLNPPRTPARFVAVVVAAELAAIVPLVVLAALWWPLAAGVMLGVLAALTPALRLRWACRSGDRRLRKAKPPGGWQVRNFAGDPAHPGAGAALLEEVCAEADDARRVLWLDTTPERLVEYYERFHFEPRAKVAMAWGPGPATLTRMVRPVQARRS